MSHNKEQGAESEYGEQCQAGAQPRQAAHLSFQTGHVFMAQSIALVHTSALQPPCLVLRRALELVWHVALILSTILLLLSD